VQLISVIVVVSHILLNFTRDAILKKHPEIAEVLNLLDGKLSTETMQQLNAKVDVDKQDTQDVAGAWLKAQGLIK
jgi:glycine betaine/choline ABC-type transport system substrate-binding protein